MTKEEAIKIIKEENLKNFNINEDRKNKPDEIIIQEKNGFWIVYTTTERAGKVTGSEMVFKNENNAWENFIERLRADKILREIK